MSIPITGFNFDDNLATRTRPVDAAQQVSGDTWLKPGARMTSTWANRVKANLTRTVLGLGGSLADGDEQLLNAVKTYVDNRVTPALVIPQSSSI
jgi:hypothetical protein